jgi:phosphate transport system protein
VNRTALDRDLNRVILLVGQAGATTETQLANATNALLKLSDWAARRARLDRTIVTQTRHEVEARCIAIIATQQPSARDLRRVLSAAHVVNELAHISEHADAVAKHTLRLIDDEIDLTDLPTLDLLRMAEITTSMLHQAMLAFDRNDAAMAQHITHRDDEVDDLHSQYLRVLLTYTMQDTAHVPGVMTLLWCARDLERAADRVTNICKRISFAVTGEVAIV